jgi:hypothetical protein
MAESIDVVRMLRPDGGWIVRGNDYEGIEFIECQSFTKKEWTDGFAQCDSWKAEQDAAKEAQRQVILDRLGLTADEAQLLLG